MSIPMLKSWDCGVVAACNHTNKPEAYDSLVASQPTRWPFCDLWDSPSRMISNLEKITGQRAGLVPISPLLVPAVCLVRLSTLAWHWITVLSVEPSRGIYRWHDGQQERTDAIPWPIIMAIAVGGVMPLPWYWRLWGAITWPVRRLW